MWRVDRLVSEQPQRLETTWHLTPEEANAAAQDHGGRTVVWFDAFDYELHDRAGSASWYAQRVEHERKVGRTYIAELVTDLRARLGLPTTWVAGTAVQLNTESRNALTEIQVAS